MEPIRELEIGAQEIAFFLLAGRLAGCGDRKIERDDPTPSRALIISRGRMRGDTWKIEGME